MLSFLLALALAAPPAGHALAGVVTDSTGAPLAEVRVTIAESNRITVTNPEGHYQFTELPSGTYTVAFARVGFAPEVRRVTIAGRDATLDVRMRPTAVELPPIQVSSTPIATGALDSPQPVSVLSADELHAAQSASLGATLEGVAGVRNYSSGTGIGKPVIRGLTSNRVLVLDNGQRMETQQWGDEHGPNVETATAERVEVIKGPASVLYGSDALGGVVNVVNEPLPDALAKRAFARGTASLQYTDNNREPDGALMLEGATGGLGVRVTGSGRSSGDVRTPSYVLWNSGNRAAGGSGSIGYRGGWGSVAGTFSQRDERISLTDEDPLATPTQRIATSRARVDAQLPLGAAHLDVLLGWERNRRREFEDDTTSVLNLGLRSTSWTGDVRFHHAPVANGRVAGVLGVSGLRTEFLKSGLETLIPNSRTSGAGLFAFEQADLGRWQLSAGARYDWRRLAVEDDADLGVTAQRRTWNSVVGNLGALYRVSGPVALVLNVGRGFRAPSTFELYSNGVHEGTVAFERGNPDLRTEKSFNTDLAVRVQGERVALEVGGYVNLIRDFIYTVPVPGEVDPASGFQVYDVTQGNARLAGFEVAARWHPLPAFHLQATADYVNGTNTTTGNPLPNMPPFRATWSARLEGKQGRWFESPYLSVSGEANARQGRLDPDEALFFAQAFEGAGFRPMSYALVHVGGGVTLLTGQAPLHLDVTVRNVFDKAYAPQLSRIKTNAPLPGMGRALVVRLSTEFGRRSASGG